MPEKREKEIQDKLAELESLEEFCCLDENQTILRMNMQSKLLHILDEEELFWFKRCKENWLLKGDNNTEFFHRVANGKKRK